MPGDALGVPGYLRIGFIALYVGGMPTARSLVWSAGLLVNIAILFIGYR